MADTHTQRMKYPHKKRGMMGGQAEEILLITS
jgi:hypothetical protein